MWVRLLSQSKTIGRMVAGARKTSVLTTKFLGHELLVLRISQANIGRATLPDFEITGISLGSDMIHLLISPSHVIINIGILSSLRYVNNPTAAFKNNDNVICLGAFKSNIKEKILEAFLLLKCGHIFYFCSVSCFFREIIQIFTNTSLMVLFFRMVWVLLYHWKFIGHQICTFWKLLILINFGKKKRCISVRRIIITHLKFALIKFNGTLKRWWKGENLQLLKVLTLIFFSFLSYSRNGLRLRIT